MDDFRLLCPTTVGGQRCQPAAGAAQRARVKSRAYTLRVETADSEVGTKILMTPHVRISMVIRSVQGEALKSAIQNEALQNAGFLYLQNPDIVSSIKDRYKKSDKTNAKRYKNVPSEGDIRNKMENLVNKSHVTAVRGDEVYFFLPYKHNTGEGTNLNNILERLFRTKRYHTEISIVEYLRRASIRIAEDDLHLLVDELKQRDYISELGNTTTYYRPGSKLQEKSELQEVSNILSDYAGDDGCLTRDEIGRALDIETVDSEIIDDLVNEQSAMYDLRDEYLVNDSKCKTQYIHALVDRKAREFEEKFKSNDWVLTEKQLETKIRSEASTFLDEVNESDIYYDIRDELVDKLELTENTDHNVTIYVMERRFDEMLRDEAERIKSEVSGEIDNSNPPPMPIVMNEYASFSKYGSDSRVDDFVRERVEARTRKAIDEDEELNVWQSIGN